MEINQFTDITSEKFEYLYLLIEFRFIEAKKSVVKIGRTSRPILVRFKEYPKGSILLGIGHVSDCVAGEKLLISEFKKRYKRKLKYGLEYFGGPLKMMEATFHEIILSLKYEDQTHINVQHSADLIDLSNVIQQTASITDGNNVLLVETSETSKNLKIDSNQSNNPEHHTTKNTLKKLKCSKCMKIFKEKWRYENHIKNLECNKLFTCEKCGKTFTRKGHLIDHYERKNGCDKNEEIPDSIICHCGKKFANNSNLVRHQKTCKQKTNTDQMLEMMEEMKETIAELKSKTGNTYIINKSYH